MSDKTVAMSLEASADLRRASADACMKATDGFMVGVDKAVVKLQVEREVSHRGYLDAKKLEAQQQVDIHFQRGDADGALRWLKVVAQLDGMLAPPAFVSAGR